MKDFESMVYELSDDHPLYFDGLSLSDQLALLGTYLLEDFGAPHDLEPFVESMCPAVNEPSPLAISFYEMLAEGDVPEDEAGQWAFLLAKAMIKNYSWMVQDAIDKAQGRPDEDALYEHMRDKRMGL